MKASFLLHHLLDRAAERGPERTALVHRKRRLDYAGLGSLAGGFAAGLAARGCRGRRVAVYLAKSVEHVAAAFGATKAGAIFVPVNPALKAAQVGHILRDCEVSLLVTSAERHAALRDEIARCPSLRTVVLSPSPADLPGPAGTEAPELVGFDAFLGPADCAPDLPATENDVAAIFYTSGSTGLPKGVVIPHRSLVRGAESVAHYLEQREDDRILAVMPLSFDAGFSQLTTAFTVGATAILMDYLHPAEVVRTMAAAEVTGLTGVPPFWIQLAGIDWPERAARSLRYFATTGGRMPRVTLDRLRARAPAAKPFLMYGLTEAFRSTYLPPEEVDRRPDSIGRAIPGQEVLVLRGDGSRCASGEVGELVHRGSTVALGYWRDPQATAERFRPVPHALDGVVLPEIAVFSGDQVRTDEEGFLYFVGRGDEMIKASGYRISPVEVEEAAYATGLVEEAAAFGVEDASLGQAVGLVAWPKAGAGITVDALRAACRERLPAYMMPQVIELAVAPLPRNPNGKIDRRRLAVEREHAAEAEPRRSGRGSAEAAE